MTQDNLISFTLTEEQSNSLDSAFNTIDDILLSALVTLKKEDKLALATVKVKNFSFIKDCYRFMKQYPDFVPPYINAAEMGIDIEAFEKLGIIYNKINEIRSALDDSMKLSGSEAYTAALTFYKYIAGAAKANVPGTKPVYEELKKRFARKTNKIEETK